MPDPPSQSHYGASDEFSVKADDRRHKRETEVLVLNANLAHEDRDRERTHEKFKIVVSLAAVAGGIWFTASAGMTDLTKQIIAGALGAGTYALGSGRRKSPKSDKGDREADGD